MDKILIIDDDESMLDTLELYLADSDYKIFLAKSGNQGINILEQEHPDIIISDVMMPEVNGLDVLMKAKKFDQNINVIMLTAFDDMESTIKAIQLGAYDYLSKPIYFFGGIGFFLLLLSSFSAAFTLYKKFYCDIFVKDQPLFLVAILMAIIGIQFIVLGLLAEINIRTYYKTNQKPPYFIKEKQGF